MMSKPVSPFLILDECLITLSETLWLKRMRRSFFHYRGWPIAEKFDDRYDTEVGGMQTMVTQWIEHGDNPIESNNISDLDIRQKSRVVEREPIILDYITGDHFTLMEAKERPELGPVVERLEQRVAEYRLFIAKMEGSGLPAVTDPKQGLGYTDGQANNSKPKGSQSEH